MRIRFTQSARKHRVSAGRARYVIEHAFVTLTLPAPDSGIDDRLVFLGDDQTGRALEVVAILLPDCLLVIHTQDLKAKFRLYYNEALKEWEEDQ